MSELEKLLEERNSIAQRIATLLNLDTADPDVDDKTYCVWFMDDREDSVSWKEPPTGTVYGGPIGGRGYEVYKTETHTTVYYDNQCGGDLCPIVFLNSLRSYNEEEFDY